MARVITFSRQFPKGHPAEGMSTNFVEKLVESFLALGNIEVTDEQLNFCDMSVLRPYVWEKWHTARNGKRWKVGMKFSPRVWSGKPYNSKQIIIAPDIEVKKVYDFKVTQDSYFLNEKKLSLKELTKVAKNDGLDVSDFECWFPKTFDGQIICWNENINY